MLEIERANQEMLFVAVALKLYIVHPKAGVDFPEVGFKSWLAVKVSKLPGKWKQILTTSHA